VKKISLVTSAYNEEKVIEATIEEAVRMLESHLPQYDYEIIMADNASTDGTRDKMEALCAKYPKVKAIFNAGNYGPNISFYNALSNATGDCVMRFDSDGQQPLDMAPAFVKEWEKGNDAVVGVRQNRNKSSSLISSIGKPVYYWLIAKLSGLPVIKNASVFFLLDRQMADLLFKIGGYENAIPFFIIKYCAKISKIPYKVREQKKTSGFKFMQYYAAAADRVTSFSTALIRICTFIGLFISIISMAFALFVFVNKLINWQSYSGGWATIFILISFLCGFQLFFLGIIGEYLLNIRDGISKIRKQQVIEKKRINFLREGDAR
jgi:glycosyltransferase involved in cell wall biosynthesis